MLWVAIKLSVPMLFISHLAFHLCYVGHWQMLVQEDVYVLCYLFAGIVTPRETQNDSRQKLVLEGQLQKVTEFIAYLEN